MHLRDFHVHTRYSDGGDTPEVVAAAAFRKGLSALGFSDHSYTAFDESYCMQRAQLADYRAEIRELKARYAGRMDIFCGVEQDGFSEAPTDDYDYVIGSLHYFRFGSEYVDVDGSPELLLDAAARYCGGDMLTLAERYYDTLIERIPPMRPDLIGHFDLIAKFNEGDALFPEQHPRYIAAWQRAADALLKLGVPFEVNTKMLQQGRRSVAYPAPPICAYLAERGGRFLLSSDSHSAETLCFAFPALRQQALPWCDWTPGARLGFVCGGGTEHD